MVFAVAPKLVLADIFERIFKIRLRVVRIAVALERFGGDFCQTYSAHAGSGRRKICIDKLLSEPNRLKYLRLAIAAQGGNAHF